jgi:hypothetical protein
MCSTTCAANDIEPITADGTASCLCIETDCEPMQLSSDGDADDVADDEELAPACRAPSAPNP